jgi:signal transduction histidine kinase
MHIISIYCYKDYGCGMSKQNISKLFEPFYTLSQAK